MIVHHQPDWLDALPRGREAVPTEVTASDIHRLEAKVDRVLALILQIAETQQRQAGACPPR